MIPRHAVIGRPKRADEGGLVQHVLNRPSARMTLLEEDGDYEAFERVLEEAVTRAQTRLLAYCVKPEHHDFRRGRWRVLSHGWSGSMSR